LKQRATVLGSFNKAAAVRDDYAAVLKGCLEEVALAQQMGNEAVVIAAESNVVSALNVLERFVEANERGAAS